MTDPTAPQPLTGEQVANWKRNYEQDDLFDDTECANALRLIATVEQLQADNAALRERLESVPCVVDEHEHLRAEVCRLTILLADALIRAAQPQEAEDD